MPRERSPYLKVVDLNAITTHQVYVSALDSLHNRDSSAAEIAMTKMRRALDRAEARILRPVPPPPPAQLLLPLQLPDADFEGRVTRVVFWALPPILLADSSILVFCPACDRPLKHRSRQGCTEWWSCRTAGCQNLGTLWAYVTGDADA